MFAQNWSKDEIIKAFYTIREYGVPGSGQAKIVDVGTEAYLKYFSEEVIQKYISQGGSTCKFFIGDYGTGKTHIIDLLHSLAFYNNMAVARTELSGSLELEDWSKITKYILQNIELEIDGQKAVSLPNIIKLMVRSKNYNFDVTRNNKYPHNGFKKAIYYYAKDTLPPDIEDILERFLQGERLPLIKLKKYGLSGVKEPLSRRNAESVFKTVTTVLWNAGLSGTILLFDENEKTLTWSKGKTPPKRIIEAANLMRRLIDSVSNRDMKGVIAVYTVLPGFVDRASEGYRALGQRLQLADDSVIQPWRWPVINNTVINSYTERMFFLQAIASKLNNLSQKCGVNTDITDELISNGRSVLAQKAGEEYRRDLLKVLTRTCLNHIEGVE